MFERLLARIKEKSEDNSAAPVLIAALGDSVTQGRMKIDVFDFKHVYHNVLKGLLERKFPRATFNVINAGVDGESAAGGLKRLRRDVLRHSPDLVVIGFCLNDSCKGREKLDEYRENLKAIFNGVKNGCDAEILALTPNFMADRKTRRIAKAHMIHADRIIATRNDGTLKAYAAALKETAAACGVPVADVYAKWEALAASGEDTTSMLVNGLNHPDAKRHRLAAMTIMDALFAGGA